MVVEAPTGAEGEVVSGGRVVPVSSWEGAAGPLPAAPPVAAAPPAEVAETLKPQRRSGWPLTGHQGCDRHGP